MIAAEEAEAVDAEGVAVSEAEAEVAQPEAEEGEEGEDSEGEAEEQRRGRGRQPAEAEQHAAEGRGAGRGERPSRLRTSRPSSREGRRLKVPKPQSTQGALAELVIIVALALGLALGIQAFIVKPYQIPSESMEPTLDVGQRVLVNRFLYRFADPDVGDIVVFHPPQGAERGNQCGVQRAGRPACPQPTPEQADVNFIKRIVAGPGDTLRIENGHPVVNGVKRRGGLHPALQPRRRVQFARRRSPFRPITTS